MKSDFFCFCYPTLLKPGMMSGGIYPPEPCITDVSKDENHTVIVTVATAITDKSKLITEVDIHYNGESVVNGNVDEFGYSEHPVIKKFPDGTQIFLTSLFVKNTEFKESGCYEVIVKLFQKSHDNSDEAEEVELDKVTSKFIVILAGEGV